MVIESQVERRLLVRSALGSPSVARSAWAEWRKTFEGPQSSSALSWAGGYIYRNLLAAGVNDEYVKGLYRHNWTKNNNTRVRALPTLRDLSKIANLTLLKSFGFVHSDYSLGFRPIADVDIFVEAIHLSDAAQYLIDRKFSPLLGVSTETLTRKVFFQRGSWNFIMNDRTDIDLHWKIFDYLSTTENSRIIKKHSLPVETEFGRCNILNSELSLAYQVYVFALQQEKRSNGLFDAFAISKEADTQVAARLLRDLDLTEETRGLVDELATALELGSDHPITKLRDLVGDSARRRESASVFDQRLSRIDKTDIRFPMLYSVWFRCGAPRWYAYLHHLLLGPMSRLRTAIEVQSSGVVHKFNDPNRIPVGFHYMYPASDYQWMHKGDARVRFALRFQKFRHLSIGKQISVRIVFDYENWKITPASEVDVYSNGIYKGKITKRQSSLIFRQRFRRKSAEISFRSPNRPDQRELGIYFNWYQFQAPLASVEFRES